MVFAIIYDDFMVRHSVGLEHLLAVEFSYDRQLCDEHDGCDLFQ